MSATRPLSKRTTRRQAFGAAVIAMTLLGCSEDGATGPTEPGNPDPDVTAPSVSLGSPEAGAELQGTVEVRAGATDDRGVTGVQLLVDDQPYGAELRSFPYRITFDSRDVADGPHTLSVRARDAAGHTAASSPISVAVYNDPGIVELTIDGPDGLEDADGFELYADRSGAQMWEIPGTGTFTISNVPAGTRRLTLGGLPPFCGADEQIVKVRSTAPAAAVLTIGCLAEAADGWLLISHSGAQSNRLSALSLRTGRETVLVSQLQGLGAVSPDGTRLAYTDNGTLMIGDLDGFAPVAVASVPAAWELSWSPDGSSLVGSWDRGGVRDLFIVDADGTDLHPVFATPGWRRRPAWSGTGRIAFEALSGGPMGDVTTIWSADPDGGNVAQLTPGIYDEAPAWSPDGTRLAFSRWVFTSTTTEVQAAVANADGTGVERVAGGEALGSPVWSPDGMWIVYSSPGGLQATRVSGTPSIQMTYYPAQALAWRPGARFD
jgi:hypothetical protein